MMRAMVQKVKRRRSYTLDYFITEWTVSDSESVTLPFVISHTYNCTVDYGDGTPSLNVSVYNDANATHIYTSGGTYNIRISGECDAFSANRYPAITTQITDIIQFGVFPFDLLDFQGCTNLTGYTATDLPIFVAGTDLSHLFQSIPSFVKDINNWDVSNVVDFTAAFASADFNLNLDNWDVSKGLEFNSMFAFNSAFDQDISGWDVGSATQMDGMFQSGVFNQNLPNWDVANVTTFESMFEDNLVFNGTVTNWVTTSATNMYGMFRNCHAFNQPVNHFDLVGVTDARSMFAETLVFNQPLNLWDVSGTGDIASMFSSSKGFSQDLSSWDVSSKTDLSFMFNSSVFASASITGWTVSACTQMRAMFNATNSFNQDIGGWDVSNVTNFYQMFRLNTGFKQDISDWDVSSAGVGVTTGLSQIFNAGGMPDSVYTSCLEKWSLLAVNSGVYFQGNVAYTKTQVDAGTGTTTTANKLVDSAQNFITTVTINDIIHNTTDGTYAKVTVIDSNIQLTLNTDIMVSGETYQVETSAAAKGKEVLVNTYGWVMDDEGGV